MRAWALGIVRNRAIDALRSASRPAPKLDRDDEAALESQPAGERTEAEAIRRETAGRLRQALGVLPREQSQVIELAYFGGFSHSEIAEMLGAPLGTVKGQDATRPREGQGNPRRGRTGAGCSGGIPVSHDPMEPTGHERFRGDLAAYALGALEGREAAELERHLAECEPCRMQLRWLQPAVDLLPRSIEQLEPPAGLRERLMATVRAEAPDASSAGIEAAAPRPRRDWGALLWRPATALAAAALLVVGVAGGYLLDQPDESTSVITRSTVARAPRGRSPERSSGRATRRS